MTLFVSLVVIIGVAAIVGRICAKSRPGEFRGPADGISLPDTGHHSAWAHTHSHHSHDGGGWGGDSGFGGDSGGGGGGD